MVLYYWKPSILIYTWDLEDFKRGFFLYRSWYCFVHEIHCTVSWQTCRSLMPIEGTVPIGPWSWSEDFDWITVFVMVTSSHIFFDRVVLQQKMYDIEGTWSDHMDTIIFSKDAGLCSRVMASSALCLWFCRI